MVKAKTKYTEKLLSNYAKFYYFKRSIPFVTFEILFEVYMIFNLISAILSPVNPINRYILAIIFEIFLVLAEPLYIWWFFKIITEKASANLTVDYEFDENKIKITTTDKASTKSFNWEYSAIYAAYETDDCFYIFNSRPRYFSLTPAENNFFIIEKSSITEGTAAELKHLLKSKLGFKKFIKK